MLGRPGDRAPEADHRAAAACDTAATGAGTDGRLHLHATEVTPGVFLVGWVEASGTSVTHAMNLNTDTVHAFWTFETPEGRVAKLHTGHLKEL